MLVNFYTVSSPNYISFVVISKGSWKPVLIRLFIDLVSKIWNNIWLYFSCCACKKITLRWISFSIYNWSNSISRLFPSVCGLFISRVKWKLALRLGILWSRDFIDWFSGNSTCMKYFKYFIQQFFMSAH